jgi:hypothetical protein
MNDRERLEQLRALVVRLERMPASAERDWVLGEIRARAVDVETGEKPAAMRALPGDVAEPAEVPAAPEVPRVKAVETVPRPKPRRRPASRRPAARTAWGAPRVRLAVPTSTTSLAAPRRRAAHHSVVDLLEQGGELCLDDPPPVADGASRPWSAGLRG